MLKCPNPRCPYTFDPAQVPKGVVLSCPSCATQFTLAPPGAAAPPPPPPAPAAEPLGPTVRRRDLPRRRSRYQGVVLAGVAAVFMAGTALAIYLKVSTRDRATGGAPAISDAEWNLSIDRLPKGWSQEEATRLKAGGAFALGFRREGPEAYAVYGRREYAKNRAPRPTEMRRDLVDPLRKLFTKFEDGPPPETAWLGQPVGLPLAFQFRAPSADGLVWQGEGYAVSYKGVAYFWLGWCGEGDFEALKGDFAAFRAGFKLLDGRKDWQEKVAREAEYKGAKVPYTFTDAEDIWKEEPVEAYKAEAPEVDRAMRVNHTPREDRKALPDDADLRVYVLDAAGGEPLDKAREFVKAYWTKHVKEANDDLPAPTFAERTGEPEGDPLRKGATPLERLESQVLDPETKKVAASTESRLIVFSAVRVGEKVVVLHCWCEFAKRGVFESRFVQIASSLR